MKNTIKYAFSAVALILIFSSCKTAPPLPGVVKPFGMIGDTADMYIYMPIQQNIKIAEPILTSIGGDAMKQALSRTKTLYSGVFFKEGLTEIRICSVGKYPYSFTDSIFKKKNGWEPKKTKNKQKYYESPYLDISIPLPEIACVVMGHKNRQKMDVFLEKLKNPQEPVFSSAFDTLINSKSQNIGIFVKNGSFFLGQILGVQLGLPVGIIEMYLKKQSGREKEYVYDLKIETKNPMTASLLKLFLKNQLNSDITLEENTIIIENRPVAESKIIAIIKSLYNY